MPYLYFSILVLTCGFAFWKGGREERIVAATSIMASAATLLVINPDGARYAGIELGVLVVDLIVLSIFVTIALRSERFWPLWIAGLQLTTSFAHGAKAIDLSLLPAAYSVAAQFWVYPILIILFVATWRTAGRRTPHPSFAD